MESTTLVQPPRLIEYPNDLSGCDALELGHRRLLYMCSKSDGGTAFVVVLGYYAGQKDDFVTKDLIEPVDESSHYSIREVLTRSLAPEYAGAHMFFL
ncbi:hypothetical protein [Nitrososphaera sp.]|uniref:hypothetical protein n=1 Tax=Nitrososphaera sp. TaxID=1971748 RepID=UPI00307F7F80